MTTEPSYLDLKDGMRIAYHKTPPKDNNLPTIIFIHGFKSDMDGTKATALEEYCEASGHGYIRFDCTGHGKSDGDFLDGTIGRWLEDTLAVIDELADGKVVIIGSSMGGWLMLLAALKRPERVAAIIGIASAPDFVVDLIWNELTTEEKTTLSTKGLIDLANNYKNSPEEEPEPYPITQLLVEESKKHTLMGGPININCPVRLIHGMKDTDVPYQISQQIESRITSQDVEVILSKNGDHRMSEKREIDLIISTIDCLLKSLTEAA